MKKILIFFTSLTHLFSVDIYSECDQFFDVSVPNLESGFELNGGLVYLQPSAGKLGWGAVNHLDSYHIKTIQPRFHAGFTAEVRYIFDFSGIDTKMTYVHVNTSDSESAKMTPDLIKAHAKGQFFYDAVNWDLGINLDCWPKTNLRVFSGITGAHIKQCIVSHFKHPSGHPKLSLNNTASFTGAGPRLGFSASYNIWCHFNFLSELGAAILLGSQTPAQYRIKESELDLEVSRQKISSTAVFQTVPSLDIKLGLQYILSICGWIPIRFEAGYRSAVYFNALRGYKAGTNAFPIELALLSANNIKHVESNFSVNGPYCTMSLEF